MQKVYRKLVTVTLDVERTKEGILCRNIETLQFVWGGKTTVGDLQQFGNDIKELPNRGGYLIGLETARKRIDWLRQKVSRQKQALDMLEGLLRR